MAINQEHVKDVSQLPSSHQSQQSTIDLDVEATCRVCHCVESEKWADSALAHLNIIPPSSLSEAHKKDSIFDKNPPVEFMGPDGNIFICNSDVESGSLQWKDSLVDLGCSCKNELSQAHYACALKWFISRDSTICEICGSIAKNVRPDDLNKITSCLRDYELLRERTENGIVDRLLVNEESGLDPVAVAAVRRQRLSEISGWFNPRSNLAAISVEMGSQNGQPSGRETSGESQRSVSRWAMEVTGILVATGMLTVILAWVIAPRVSKV